LTDQVKEDEIDRACNTHGREEECIPVLVGKPGGKRPLGRLKLRCKDNIKMDLKEIERWVWTGFIWPRMVSCSGLFVNLRVS
jgi:hypothetical protein